VQLVGNLSADERLVVAARIAATIVFANRYAVWTGIDRGDVPEADIPVSELSIGVESISGRIVCVDQAAIEEALSTGLFSSRGLHRMGFAHQTFAEFLAAWYVTERNLTPGQRRSLIVHSGDPDQKIVPQLHETAAWLASMDAEIFRDITRRDPEVLFRSDVATADIEDRRALVDALLALYREERALDLDLDRRRRYGKLAHPDLPGQLRPVICDTGQGPIVRRVAIDVAEACRLSVLVEDLVRIALDQSEPHHTRVQAACAVWRIGDATAREQLLPLARGEAGDDSDDQLKGCALRALWPDHLSARELFSLLKPPRRTLFLGTYQAFLLGDLLPHLLPADLPWALRWITEQQAYGRLPDAFGGPADAIMLQGWGHLDDRGVLVSFARAAVMRLKQHDHLVGGEERAEFVRCFGEEREKRLRLLEAMVTVLIRLDVDPLYLLIADVPLVTPDDIPWLIRRLQRTRSRRLQQVWAGLIERVFIRSDPTRMDMILEACKDNEALRDAFSWLLTPVRLDSPEAERMRADYNRMREYEARSQARPLVEPPPAVRIVQQLDSFEAGDLDAWWRLNREMTLRPDSTHYGGELESDLTTLPGWQAADEATQLRIIRAAHTYLLQQMDVPTAWLDTNAVEPGAFAGYRAFRLLAGEAPELLAQIQGPLWERWAPILLGYPTASDGRERDIQRLLVGLAYGHAPAAIVETLMRLIDKEDNEEGPLWIMNRVRECWDEHLANAILLKAQDESLKPENMATLLAELIDHNAAEALAYAGSLVTSPLPPDEAARRRALNAAFVLLTHAPDGGWPVVRAAMQEDRELGSQLVTRAAGDPANTVFPRLREDGLADLYLWLVEQFPPADDPPQTEGGHWVGPREHVAWWRDGIARHLADRSTPEAVRALRRLVRERPELEGLKWTLLSAEANTRRRTWVPPRPDAILKLALDRQARLVQNGDELLDVLLEALQRLQEKLHGETPAIRDIWDRLPKGRLRPIGENEFSDYVKRFLDDDLRQKGIVVNREVVIRARFGSASGERTDIHVDAISKNAHGEVYDTITAVIEVKGCWHPELDHAMKSQLADRYLADNHYRHGLYLIGWFNCDDWDPDDSRRGDAPQLTLEEADAKYSAQAAELSDEQTVSIRVFVMDTALR
jgi:predicted NACHT family NTPase